MADLIDKWETMRALQAINPVAKLMDGDFIVRISLVENVLEHMPSAEPERKTGQWKLIKKAKFEYDEAWRIITHPTPDVTYADKNRARIILDTFKDSLGMLNE